MSDANAKPPASDAWKVAAWGLATFGASRVAAMALEQTGLAASVASAVIAEWGAGRLGVAWSDPDAPPPETAAIAKRAAVGAAIGAVVAAELAFFLSSTHAVALTRTSFATSVVVDALVSAGLLAMRDELLLHGVVLRAMLAVPAALPRVFACGLTSAAAAFGDGATAQGILVRGLFGLVLGALWVRDRGAWMAWGGHLAFLFGTRLLLAGGLFDAKVLAGSWGGGAAGPLQGSAAVVAVVPFAIGAVIWAARRSRVTPAS